MNKLLLVTGANGQVATEYQLSPQKEGWDYMFLTKEELDITDAANVRSVFEIHQPQACLNLAAYTDVEKAEIDQTELAYMVNAVGPEILAGICKEIGIPLIHISTDYVFDGKTNLAYTEEDMPAPLNNYGRTKFLGEKAIEKTTDWYYILRISWVYSNHAKNFFNTMLNLAQERTEISVVADQFGCPTSTKEICRALDAVLEKCDQKELSGLYHFCGKGKVSWKGFAEEIFHLGKVAMLVNGTSSKSWPSKVKRPENSAMHSAKFAKTFNYVPMHWKNALMEVISERKKMPIKVGDTVVIGEDKMIIVTTDWSKKIARLAKINNMNESVEVSFEALEIYDRN